MHRICIVVADAARARLYTYEPGDYPATERRAELVERADLVNPERRLRPSEVHSDRPGTARTPTGVLYGMGDHRVRREHEVDLRFAGEIYRQLDDLLSSYPAPRVVVVASHGMLGHLRQWTGGLAARSIALDEVSADLTRETTPELHDHLAKLELIPARLRLKVTS